MPAELRIDRQVLTVLAPVLAAVAPEEGCALLLGERRGGLGHGTGDVWFLRRIWPCRNTWEPPQERRRRFAIDPREQLLAQKWSRARGLRVLGTAHSHPEGSPEPSPVDRALAFAPALMLILALPSPGQGTPALGCWWLAEPCGGGEVAAHRLGWKMES